MKRHQYSEHDRFLLEQSPMPYAIYQFIDKRVVTLILSEGFRLLFGYSTLSDAYYDMDHDMYRDTHPDDVGRISDAAFRFATEGGRFEVIYRTKKEDGVSYRVIHAKGEHFYTEDGTRLAWVWYTDEGSYTTESFENVAELSASMQRALHEHSILRASRYDHLTGLPNMGHFFELLEDGKQAILNRGGNPVLLFTDFSGMKFYNHRYGFAEGDKLLLAYSKLIASYFSTENCGRFGQDHFVICTEREGLEDRLKKLFKDAEKMHEGMSLPLRVGIYSDEMESVDPATATDRAKFACDALRNTHISAYNFFDKNLRDRLIQRQYVLDHLDQALEEKWIQVYYQPIVRAVNGRVCDEEALARWIDPERGLIPPLEFIPFLEQSLLIYKVDLYIVDEVLKKLKTMQEAGLPMVPQSVNLSRADFAATDMAEEIRRRVDEAGIPRELITIEITESVIGSNFEFIREQVLRFQAMGFAVWMDDFGSGYSSLDVMQSIPFQLIKFDMHFMQQFDGTSESKIVLTELIKMATALGIDTVAEGVENAEQVRFLQEIGCSKLQGYYYTKPLSLPELLKRYELGRQIGFENPEETAYFESIGRVNLYNLESMVQEETLNFRNYFDALPMGILEYRDEQLFFVRSNPSYREFLLRKFNIDLLDGTAVRRPITAREDSNFMKMIRESVRDGNRMITKKTFPDGSVVQYIVRRMATNPVNGAVAIGIAVLYIADE